MSDTANTAAMQMQSDSFEMAGLLVDFRARQAVSAGRLPERSDLTQGVGVLLATAWELAKLAHADQGIARVECVALLRKHADDLERVEG